MEALTEKQDHGSDIAAYPPGVAFHRGRYVPISEATVSVLDWGFLHSDATYDTVHVWDGRFFRLDLHIKRFRRSMEKLRLQIPYDDAQLQAILTECVRRSGHRRAYVEMICTRGVSPTFSRDPRDAINQFIAFAVPFGSVANKEQLQRGLKLAVVDIRRIPPQSVDPTIKNYHWLDLVVGLLEGYDRDAETVLVRDLEGNIAEGPGFNVFVIKSGALTTPATGVLPGITRQSVIDLCALAQRKVAMAPITNRMLREADEVFITSTAGGVMPVTVVDGRPVGDGKVGPVTRKIMTAYWDAHSWPDWTTPVDYN